MDLVTGALRTSDTFPDLGAWLAPTNLTGRRQPYCDAHHDLEGCAPSGVQSAVVCGVETLHHLHDARQHA